ncbi:XtrA/YqaO family protein [Bacillus suaedae]|uniref:XtrA/YqaO family protein n=1 Tax=Halalkalibacter suaedae TaxID=2822140 RepID=A0A940WPT8_9BACI|nr:XtrA/YqaO family protein [Bacillus suaedae]MBP3950315.1 XtrA/YqaO family protein [Bacillus suaedae]
MRLKNVDINPKSGKIELDILKQDKPIVLVVSDGRVRFTELPVHGETIVVTHQGKVKRVKFDEGEDF